MEDTHVYCPWDGKPYLSNVCLQCGRQRYIKKPQWKKVLYEKQPFEDTYVSENFLHSLVPKENKVKYEYATLIDSTVEISYAFNLLVLFLLLQEIARLELISDSVLILFALIVLICGYSIYLLLLPAEMRTLKPVRVGCLLLGILYTLCPVLATINKNYADDTIFLMTFIFCVLHLVCYDYSFVKNAPTRDKRQIPDAKSMNFSLIAAVLLASRLSSMNYVFFLLSSSFMIFGFSHYLRSAVFQSSKSLYAKFGVVLSVVNTVMVIRFSYLLAGVVLFMYFFIRYLGPLWLLSVYHYKNEIKGPWDLPEIKRRT